MTLTLDVLKSAISRTAAAFRCVTDYEPAGGPTDKIFPSTYEGGQYAVETRIMDGAEVQCVLIDSVQAQANRMEEVLLDAWERRRIPLPVITVDFNHPDLLKRFRVTSLDAPHRIADALLRDSLLDGQPFRKSTAGRMLDHVDLRNSTPLFELCPTALLFGMWDSTGPRGGLGAKFQRAIVSEIIGINARQGRKTSSRIDPAQILLDAGPLYAKRGGDWTLREEDAVRDKKDKPIKLGKDGKPSEANHGNVKPTIADGGFTVSKARQTTVLSLTALRRLRFPLQGASRSIPAVDDAARTALAALGLCAAALTREQGADLRSRCQLHATTPIIWELLDAPGEPPTRFELPASAALELYGDAVNAARTAGLPWRDDEVTLTPSDSLLELVKKSQLLAAREAGTAEV
jgi:CRISPR-associated protein Csb1